jgi:TonB family protein
MNKLRAKPQLLFLSLLLGWVVLINPEVSTLRAQSIPDIQGNNRAVRLAQAGDPQEAVAAMRDVVAHHKNFANSWYYLGFALTRAGEIEEARKAFKEAISLAHDNAFFLARIGLARTYLLANQLDEAEKQGRRILGKKAGAANTHYIFGLMHLFGGDPARALEEADASIKTDPSFAAAFLLKNQAILQMPKRDDPAKSEVENREQYRQWMENAFQCLKAYLVLTPAERNNSFLLGQMEAIRASLEAEPNPSSVKHVFSSTQLTTKARILSKPEPQYTVEARSAYMIGTVVLRAVFSAEGKVEHILVVRSLPFGLSERAVEAARQIKFTPATKDGHPVSMWMQLEYNFNLY